MSRPLVTVKRLLEQVRHGAEIEIPEHALVTPAAADWLRTSRHPVRRVAAAPPVSSAPRYYLIGNGGAGCVPALVPGLERRFPTLEFLSCRGDRRCCLESLTKVCNGLAECERRRAVVVIESGTIASCVANKYPHVRAAILAQASDLRMLQRELGINMLILETRRLSLRQIQASIERFLSSRIEVDPLIGSALSAAGASLPTAHSRPGEGA